MLTFAPPSESPSLTAWLGALAAPLAAWFAPEPASGAPVPAGDAPAAHTPAPWNPESEPSPAGGHASYWPCERLNAFILQMAAHGHCVNAAMMLGHRAYAEQQLAKALAVRNDGLRALAAELHAYFEAPPESAALQLNADPAGAEPAVH